MAKEINLVPDIKNEFIKTLKFRNLVFFLCIVTASASLVVILIFLSISGGQQGIINAKQSTLTALEQKINAYSDLSDFLTIRDQLGNIANITENKIFMSRTFNILSAIIPTGQDYINISELTINLSDENPTFTFDAQANAGSEPYIDYNVLDSFKKSMAYMRYDYGEFVDREGNSIPSYCIVEIDGDGATLRDQTRGYYAYWLIQGEGCNPSAEEEENTADYDEDEDVDTESEEETPALTADELAAATGYQIEQYNDQNVVRIWRTPQYTDWYKEEKKDGEPYLGLDGTIENVAHFDSKCIKYSGVKNDNGTITWSAVNDACKLVASTEDNETGIIIEDSSNGRDANDELVLRFSAEITFVPEVFNFNNHHMLALPPAGRRNVTDSYSQIQSMFAERASDCAQDDTACTTTPTSASDSSSSSNLPDVNNEEEDF